MERINIIGCGGHARSVADIILCRYPDVEIVFYDSNAREKEVIFSRRGGGYRVYTLDKFESLRGTSPVFCAIGNNNKRKESIRKYCLNEHNMSVISLYAMVSRFSTIGDGNFVSNMTYIGPDANIGDYNIINTASIIEHEVQVGSFSHISINSTICGRCKIGNNVFVGAGATIIDKISICDNVMIGANSVVIEDIIQPGVYVGNPAKFIKPIK